MKHNSKLWSILCISLVLVLLTAIGIPTAVIDPFFHYHAPLDNLSYPLINQRYQNDGIVRHFDYDALITGTSMTENFKTSEFDALFDAKTVKVSFSGAAFPELITAIEQAIEHNSKLNTILLCIDEWFLYSGRELVQATGTFPTYLYDDNPFNDVEYLLNREIFWGNTLEVLNHTRQGLPTTSFDEYGSWVYPYDAEIVLANYDRPKQLESTQISEHDISRLKDTLENTLVQIARQNPQIQFLVYFPPYSILTWDQAHRHGQFYRNLQLYELASEILLEAENIRLYSFLSDFETITDLDKYRDIVHHSDKINSLLLQRIRNGEYLLTKENYKQHWQEVTSFYENYNYEALFTSK